MALFDRSVSWVTGPLACYAAGFAAELPARGWGSDSIYVHLRLMRELSAWMSAQGLGTGQLSPAEADRFVPVMRATRRRLVSVKGLAPVLGYLRDQGVLPEPDVVPASERDALLLAYQQYLRGERGLSDATVRTYTWFAAAFLDRAGDPLREVLAGLTGPDVLGILERQLKSQPRRRSAGSAVLTAQVARSLLRFLHASGRVPRDLAPPSRGWPGGGWPGCLPGWTPRRWRRCWTAVTAPPRSAAATTLSCCYTAGWACARPIRPASPSTTSTGGLARSRSAARAAGRTRSRCSGTWARRWPAICGTGGTRRAGRCSSPSCRPSGGWPANGLGAVVHRACRRAGVPECGPHTLRHSLASGLLAAGASLPEIGEILRHSDPRTTAIYAKVDRAALASLVRPWPAEAAS